MNSLPEEHISKCSFLRTNVLLHIYTGYIRRNFYVPMTWYFEKRALRFCKLQVTGMKNFIQALGFSPWRFRQALSPYEPIYLPVTAKTGNVTHSEWLMYKPRMNFSSDSDCYRQLFGIKYVLSAQSNLFQLVVFCCRFPAKIDKQPCMTTECKWRCLLEQGAQMETQA